MKTRAPFLLAALTALWTVTAATAAVPAPAAAGHLDVGSKLYWETHGDAGPVLVLIHDGLVHHEVWDAQIAPHGEHGAGRRAQPDRPRVPVAAVEALPPTEESAMSC